MHHVKQGEEVLPGLWVPVPKYKEGLMPAPLVFSSRSASASRLYSHFPILKHAHPAITQSTFDRNLKH